MTQADGPPRKSRKEDPHAAAVRQVEKAMARARVAQQQQQMAQGGPEPAVAEALQKMMQDPKVQGMCGAQIQGNTTGVGEECWRKIWAYVGCTSQAPPYMTWHNSQSYEILLADAVQWANMPSEKHRLTCYGKTEL